MARIEKRLTKWLSNPPRDTPISEVKSVLERFFSGQFTEKSGSHIVVSNDRLKGVPGYGPDGDFTIAVKGGQRVKGFYLRALAQTIVLLGLFPEGEE